MNYKSNGRSYDKSKFLSFVNTVMEIEDEITIIYVNNIKKFTQVSMVYYGKDTALAEKVERAKIFDIPVQASIIVRSNEYMLVRNNAKVVIGEYY